MQRSVQAMHSEKAALQHSCVGGNHAAVASTQPLPGCMEGDYCLLPSQGTKGLCKRLDHCTRSQRTGLIQGNNGR